MDARYTIRKAQLLEECQVVPAVFAPVIPRLLTFMEPFVDTLHGQAPRAHVQTYVRAIVSGTNFAGPFCACFACQNRGFRGWFSGLGGVFGVPKSTFSGFHLGGEATLPPLTPSKSLGIPAGNGQELPSKNRAGHYWPCAA